MAGHKVRPSLRVGLGAAALTLLSIGAAHAEIGFHRCAIMSDGDLQCWGEYQLGQLGTDRVSLYGSPELGTGRTAVQVATSKYGSCAILDNGGVKCWGATLNGEFGAGEEDIMWGLSPNEMGDNLPYVDLGTGRTAIAIAGGTSHYCAVLDNGRVKCWGNNEHGQLGQGDLLNRGDDPGEMGDNLPYIDLGTNAQGQPLTATAVATQSDTVCAIMESGQVKCWGDNAFGTLGAGDTVTRGDNAGEMGNNLPYVDLGTDAQGQPLQVTDIDVGGATVCATLSDHSVKCWGYGETGQLGLGYGDTLGDHPNEMGNNLPYIDLVHGAGPDQVVSELSISGYEICAVLQDQRLKCWGAGGYGNSLGSESMESLGDDPNEMGWRLPYVDLGAGVNVVSVAAASSYEFCAISDSGQVKCWGVNYQGRLGYETDGTPIGDEFGEMGDNLPYVNLGANSRVASLSNSKAPICNDEDADGLCAYLDNCPEAANANQADGDSDGIGDACDACPGDAINDVDGDGTCATVDNCPVTANANQADGDGDGIGDVCDACPADAANDADNDGLCANLDNCPITTNANQADGDSDGIGDVCDACPNDSTNDADNDGVCQDVDNCPQISNPAQVDDNNDGFGDACVSPDVSVHPTATVDNGALIGPNGVVGAHSHIYPTAIINGTVGSSTTIRMGAVISAGAIIGDHVVIGENAFIGPNCVIGSRAEVGSVVTGDNCIIGDRAFIDSSVTLGDNTTVGSGANVSFSNDIGDNVIVGDNASIGAEGQIGDDCTIGGNTQIGFRPQIERNVQITGRSTIGDNVTIRQDTILEGSVYVGDDVFIAERCILASGARIGASSLIAADSEIRGELGEGVLVGHNNFLGNHSYIGNNSWLSSNVTIGIYVTLGIETQLGDNTVVYDGVTTERTAFIQDNVTILFRSHIGERAVVADNVIIDEQVTIGPRINIGLNSRLWPFSTFGADVTIGDDVLIRSEAVVGDDVTIEDNVLIYPETTIGDDTTIRAGVTLGAGDCYSAGCGNVLIGECADIETDLDPLTVINSQCALANGSSAEAAGLDCLELLNEGNDVSGTYWIDPDGDGGLDPFQAYCDMTNDGGGWTLIVFNNTNNNQALWNQNWATYKAGFGDTASRSNGWLGNDRLHALTANGANDMQARYNDNPGTQGTFGGFIVQSEANNYRMTFSGVTSGYDNGNFAYHSGQMFSTSDRDNDSYGGHCGGSYANGWWFRSCWTINPIYGKGRPYWGQYMNSISLWLR